MNFSTQFITASPHRFCSFEQNLPAPCLRRSFTLDPLPAQASLSICGLGFYRLFLNGKELTKGFLAPYITNPDDLLFYDQYDLTPHLQLGKNTLALLLGNGMQNAFGGAVWDFEKARFRSAPKVALTASFTNPDGSVFSFEADPQFKTADSPITSDELRCGEYYDARLECDGWNLPSFDDSDWKNAFVTKTPYGTPTLCDVEPILISQRLSPVSITAQNGGWLYDFGVNDAGVCSLCIDAQEGQVLTMVHGEQLIDGIFHMENINSFQGEYCQTDRYTCKAGKQTHVPSFTYHGFQYVFVTGITPEQATPELLTFLVFHSDLTPCGDFSCSDPIANALQKMTRRSTLSNFLYFPTDCPHREKNGWTGDAALSAEHTLLNLHAEKSYRQWLHCIRAAQRQDGGIPAIVPTSGWGFDVGPAWDAVLTFLPYEVFALRGDLTLARENIHAIFHYLSYLSDHRNDDGLISIGLGDWCPPHRAPDDPRAPRVLTNTLISMDICKKAALLFHALELPLQEAFAHSLYLSLRKAGRERLLNLSAMTALGDCQTSQAMAIFYDLFEPAEKIPAFQKLLGFIHDCGDHLDTGILGARILFRTLSAFGQGDLAYTMITRPDAPSYGSMVAHGSTTLWEIFHDDQTDTPNLCSLNHHFFGDISAWMITCLAGIQLNPHHTNIHELLIQPDFIAQLDHAHAFHNAPDGRIDVKWAREAAQVRLTVQIPQGMTGRIQLPAGWCFADGTTQHPAQSGEDLCAVIAK